MVWKVLLGVVPLVKDAWQHTWGEQGRTGVFNDLKRWKDIVFSNHCATGTSSSSSTDDALNQKPPTSYELTALDLVKSRAAYIRNTCL